MPGKLMMNGTPRRTFALGGSGCLEEQLVESAMLGTMARFLIGATLGILFLLVVAFAMAIDFFGSTPQQRPAVGDAADEIIPRSDEVLT
jgi:hypothetical protein